MIVNLLTNDCTKVREMNGVAKYLPHKFCGKNLCSLLNIRVNA